MAVKIRLSRHGRKGLAFYRVVVADKEMKRDGRFLEILGTVNPKADPAVLTIKQDRLDYWVGVGAKPSDTVSQLVDKINPGYFKTIETKRTEKIRSRRALRKQRAKKKN